MKPIIYLSVISLMVALTPVSAEARGRGEGGHLRTMMKKLGLSAEQKEKLAELRKSQKGKSKELRESMKAARDKLEKALSTDASDSQLRAAHQEVQSAKSKLGDLRFEKILAIRSVLTPDQRKKFQEMKPKRGKHLKRRHRGNHVEGDLDDEDSQE